MFQPNKVLASLWAIPATVVEGVILAEGGEMEADHISHGLKYSEHTRKMLVSGVAVWLLSYGCNLLLLFLQLVVSEA